MTFINTAIDRGNLIVGLVGTYLVRRWFAQLEKFMENEPKDCNSQPSRRAGCTVTTGGLLQVIVGGPAHPS